MKRADLTPTTGFVLATLMTLVALVGCGEKGRKETPSGRQASTADDAESRRAGAERRVVGEHPTETGERRSSEHPSEQPQGHPGEREAEHAGHSASAAAGIRWTAPDHWIEQPARAMRVATYAIPAAPGDAEGAECAVFFFGSGQGGDVSSNIARWASQFEGPPGPERATREIAGIRITTVRIAGTYLAPAGPMMQSQGKKEGYLLLGAIAEAPDGSVFFKLTGPRKTVDATEKEFESLVSSIAKG